MAKALILMGPPGSGKSTQARLLAAHLGGVHISTGELLRALDDTTLVESIDRGNLADTAVVIRVTEAAIAQAPADRPIVFDGICRKLGEAQFWLRRLPELDRPIAAIIFLEVPRELALARNAQRGRVDDAQAWAERRWEKYCAETMPVVDFLRQQGLLKVVDGVGTVTEVAVRIAAVR